MFVGLLQQGVCVSIDHSGHRCNASDQDSHGVEAAWEWAERHTSRILLVSALATVNIIVVEVLRSLTRDVLVYSLLVVGLALVQFLLLHRVGVRTLRFALGTARRQASISRGLLQSVARFGTAPAGHQGTVEALAVTATEVGCEVWVWDRQARTLWSPAAQERYVLTAARTRQLIEVMSSRKPVPVGDTSIVSYLPTDIAKAFGARALLIAPMWTGDDLLGIVIKRYSSRRSVRHSSDASLVSGLAALGGVAIGKAMVVDREQQRVRDIELLLQGVSIAGDTMHKDQLTDYARQLAEAVHVSRSAIFAVHAGQLRIVGSCGIESSVQQLSKRIPMRSRFARMMRTHDGAPLVITRSDVDDHVASAIAQLGFGASVVVQAVHDASGLVAVVIVDAPRGPGDLTQREQALVMALARQVSLCLERARMQRSMNKRSRHLANTPRLARSLTGQRDPGQVAAIAARELHESFGYDRVSIALMSDAGTLEVAASAGMLARSNKPAEASRELVTACESGRIYVSCAGERDSALPAAADDHHGISDPNAPAGCRSQLVVPISGTDGSRIGVIAVYERNPESLGEDDVHILQTIADQLSATCEQAMLFDTLERSYFKTVEALSAALEAKDAYTLDHARSITDLSAEVGRKLGMGEDEIRDLKLGALLHDIGKIGIPGEILNKPGPLTDEEFEVMKEHTVIGEQIIAPIEFLEGVRPLVLHEHERWDGAGYPHGLSGEAIPLGARIIFVCDAWHAMTSDRPYRASLDLDEAFDRLRAGAGSQFDPSVVDAFVDVISTDHGAALAGISPDR